AAKRSTSPCPCLPATPCPPICRTLTISATGSPRRADRSSRSSELARRSPSLKLSGANPPFESSSCGSSRHRVACTQSPVIGVDDRVGGAVLHEGVDQCRLAAHAGIDGVHGDLRPLGDPGDRGLDVPLFREQFPRNPQNLGAGRPGGLCPSDGTISTFGHLPT